MRYFSFASRCRIFNQINIVKRPVSYRTRKNLVSVMSHLVTETAPEGLKSAIPRPNHCSTYDVSVISNGSLESSSLVVTRESASCIFNCGEGMQRLANEHGIKLFKTKVVFLTYHSWKSIGGIMALCLSLQMQGINTLIIYGPPCVRELILGLRLFVTLKAISLRIITDRPQHMYDDGLFKVQFVPIYPSAKNDAHRTASKVNISHVNDDGEAELNPPPSKRTFYSEAREPKANEIYSLCYICESPEVGMHLNLNKCLSLGVPQGPLMGLLKQKNNVKLENGRIVEWQDVCDRTGQSNFFLVVDCPGEEFLEPFVNEPSFIPHQGSSDNEKAPTVVYHFTEKEIMDMPKYQEWMSRFPPNTVHVILNSGNSVLDHVESYRLQEKLSLIDPVIFPKLQEDNVPEVKEECSGLFTKHTYLIADDMENGQVAEKAASKSNSFLQSQVLKPGLKLVDEVNGMKIIQGFSTLRWKLIPKSRYLFQHSMHLDRKACLSEISDVENVLQQVENLQNAKMCWESSPECMALPEYPKVLFLGTGSSAPHSLRNTSGILIELECGNLVMLDCGEGTYGQMLRFFGKEKIKDILKRLRLIYVSHQHADHHLGLINILRARFQVLSQCKREEYKPEMEPPDIHHLLMIIPSSVRDWVHISNLQGNLTYDARIISTLVAVKSYSTLKRYTNNLGIVNFRTVTVPHSHESFAVTFATSNGYRITYSGDTPPSDNVVILGKDSDLLIHEATFEDGMETMAKQKKHSTIGQALNIGKRMGAKFVMLTHFSQRYSHLPQLNTCLPDNVGIAFDNMLVTPKTLPFLSQLEPFYRKIFARNVLELNKKTTKRILKKERELELSAALNV